MKITSITAIPLSYRLPEGKTVKLGVGATTKRDAIVVRVQTDEGLTGYGEAHPGRSPGAVTALVNSTLDPLLAGMDPCNVVGVWARVNRMQLSSHGLGAGAALALSGIDLALWDIRGKAANMPLYRLLGGSRKRLPAYAGGISMGFQPPDSLVEEARGYVRDGYRAVKLRLGDNVGATTSRACRRCAPRSGPRRHHRRCQHDYAGRRAPRDPGIGRGARRLARGAVQRAGLRQLPRGAGLSPLVPLAAGENHYTRWDFARLMEDKAVTILQPDLSKTGGITEALRIAAMGSAFGIALHPQARRPGSTMRRDALPRGDRQRRLLRGLRLEFNPLRDMFGRSFEIGDDGCVEPLDRPGIGLRGRRKDVRRISGHRWARLRREVLTHTT